MNECARLCAVFQHLSSCDRMLVTLILLRKMSGSGRRGASENLEEMDEHLFLNMFAQLY